MPIELTCSHCRKRLNAPDQMAGARVKCPSCRAVLQVPSPQNEPASLVDLLEEVTAAPPAAAMAKPAGGPFSSAPKRPAAKSTPAWKQGASAGFLKDNVWTIVTVLSGIPYMLFFQHVLFLIPWLIAAPIVFISERGRRSHGKASGLNPVDRILFGIIVGLNLTADALVAIIGVVKGAQLPEPGPAIGIALGTAFVMLIGNIPGWLISYFFARAFGLGRTYGVLFLLGGLGGIVMLIAFPGGMGGQAFQMAVKAGVDAGRANQQRGGPPGVNRPGFVNVPQNNPANAPLGIPQPNMGNPPAGVPQPIPQQADADRNAEEMMAAHEKRVAEMEQANLERENTRKLNLHDRLKHSFAWNKAKTRDLLAARLIINPDNDEVVDALRRAPALERPMMNLSFMLGITGLDRPARNGIDWGEQKGAEGDYRHASGDAGMLLLHGLQSRVESGAFGDWGCDVQPPKESDPRAVLFATADGEDFLRTFAAQQHVDILIALNMTNKTVTKNNRTGVVTTLVVRLVDVAPNNELWASEPLTSVAIAAGRAKGSDPGVQVVNELLEYIDQNLTLEPLPRGTPEDAAAEADRLTANKKGSKMLTLATLRVFQCQGLITPEQSIEYADRVLSREGAENFASDEPIKRFEAIAKFIPEH